ncbi:MAG: hypothetical protein ABW134_11700 [Candidatus Thiodiazotropha endolucinida]
MIVKPEDVKQLFNEWSDWKISVSLGELSALDAHVTDTMSVTSGQKPSTIVPAKYLDESTSKEVQIVEACFSRWPEAHQVAVTFKYLMPGYETEKARMQAAAREIRCGERAVYSLISEAHMMVWQVHNFDKLDLLY